MKLKIKNILSLLFTLSIILTALAFPQSVLASEFKNTIEAFTYNGYSIPAYDGDLYEVINSNNPSFSSSELNQTIYESYSPLDSLGRVGVCSANIDKSIMPTEERGDIKNVYPTGWVQKKYETAPNSNKYYYLYNRSHLIAHQLTGENANKKNLMTGTISFNQKGMVPFENEVAAYVKADGRNNVLYRVTPVFDGDNLLAYGVIMEAESVDDLGSSVKFCVFVYNVQNGVSIDYETGNSIETGETIDLSAAYIQLSKSSYVYTGKAIKPKMTVSVNYINLNPDEDYTVKYSSNTKVGTATITVTGKGAYCGEKKYTFMIIPKTTSISKLTKGKKSFTAVWRKQSVQTDGYQLQYSKSSKFKSTKMLTIKKNTTTKLVVKKLAKNKKYYVRVRTYKKVGGKNYYSAWSKVKTVTTKK